MVTEWFAIAIAIAKSEGLWQSIDLTLVFLFCAHDDSLS